MSDVSFSNLIGIPGLTSPGPVDGANPNGLDFSQFLDDELMTKKKEAFIEKLEEAKAAIEEDPLKFADAEEDAIFVLKMIEDKIAYLKDSDAQKARTQPIFDKLKAAGIDLFEGADINIPGLTNEDISDPQRIAQLLEATGSSNPGDFFSSMIGVLATAEGNIDGSTFLTDPDRGDLMQLIAQNLISLDALGVLFGDESDNSDDSGNDAVSSLL